MKRSPKPGDMNQRMYAVVQEAAGLVETEQTPEKNPAAVERGRLGGRARADSLEREEMRKIALEGVIARREAREAPEAEERRQAEADAAEMRKRA